MKKIFCGFLILLSACGAPHPFQRGEKLSVGDDLVIAAGNEDQANGLSQSFFQQTVLPMLDRKCSLCHGNPAPDFNSAEKMVEFKKPEVSELLLVSAGKASGHSPILRENSVEYGVLVSWINGASGADAPTTTTTTTTITTTTTTVSSTTTTTVPSHVPTGDQLNLNFFTQKLYPVLDVKCSLCHENPGNTFEAAKKIVVFKDINNSELYLYGAGKNGHRAVLKEGSPDLQTLVDWINGAVLN